MSPNAIEAEAPPTPVRMARTQNWQKVRRVAEPYLFVVPAVIMLATLLFYPLYYTARLSLSEFDSARFAIGDFVGFKNYASVLRNSAFWSSLRVTVIYLVASLPLQMALGTAIALILAVEWPGVRIVRALFIIPMVVTLVVAGTVWKMLLDPLWGFSTYLLGLIGIEPILWFSDPTLAMTSIVMMDTWRWTPFIALIILAGVVSLDREPFEAAEVDGASAFQRLVYVKLPMLMPVILSALVVRWLGAIKMFDIVLTSTQGGPGTSTEVINLYIYELTFRRLSFDRAAASIVLVGIASVFLTFLIMRFGAKKEE
jgi:multiple sugar transport system permease protein